MAPTRKKRIQFDFTLPEIKHLDNLVKRTGNRTRVEVFRRALQLYDGVVSAIQQGSTIVIEDPDGERRRMNFLP